MTTPDDNPEDPLDDNPGDNPDDNIRWQPQLTISNDNPDDNRK